MEDNRYSKKVNRVLEVLKEPEITKQRVLSIYNNAIENESISEEEREAIIGVAEFKIRSSMPNTATRMFGPKDQDARELLQGIYDELSEEYDFSDNCVGNGVKTGGDMISGKSYVSIYISYKNKDRWHMGLSYNQKTSDSDPRFVVAKYHKGESNPDGYERSSYSIENVDEALSKYRSYLSEEID